MESLVTLLKDVFKPPWNYILGAIGFLLGLAPRILELGSGWQDLRSGRKRMEDEQKRYELLKLRYEIEALKAQHHLPDLDVAPAKLAAVAPTAPRESAARPIPHWQQAYPRVTTAVLAVLQAIVGIFAGMAAILAVTAPFFFQDPGKDHLSWSEIGGLEIVYLLMTWGLIVMYRALGRRKKSIAAHRPTVRGPDAPGP